MAVILILGVKIPFTRGGQDVLVETLRRELQKRGHLVDLIELPLSVLPKESILNQAAMWRALNLQEINGQKIDLVIPTKFPSYYVRHPRKSLWLVHQHRAIYDLYGTRFSDISDDPRDEALRQMLIAGDKVAIEECAYISGISKNVVARLEAYNRIQGEALYPPLPLAGRYYSAPAENYILSVGRLCAIKRVDLMLKAMPTVHAPMKLKIVGTPDEPGVMQYYQNEIAKHHIADRVEFLGRVDDAALLDLYAKAFAVYYAPFNEDYGYVTLEAMASGKPVVTAHDSGGVLEFISHNENGLISEPTTDALSRAVNSLIEDRAFAARLGQAGREYIDRNGLAAQGWDRVIDSLLSPLSRPASDVASPDVCEQQHAH